MIAFSEQYGTEVGVGGSVDMKSGSVDVVSGSQTTIYKLYGVLLVKVTKEWNCRVCMNFPPAVVRYFDP